ncbi:MAG: choice-of-anchor D domain-containing protein, partial [Candidatus Accumulibacter meliphilus]
MAQTVIIGDAGVEVVDVPPNLEVETLILGNTALGNGTLNLYDNGILTIGSSVAGQLIIGNEGSGTIVMQGGTLDVLNSDINVNAFIIGNQASGSGLFQQSGGTVTSARQLQIGNDAGSQGVYLLSGDGVLNAPLITVGFNGYGSFAQTGPDTTVNASGGLFIGTTGSLASPGGDYTLDEGQLVVGGLGTILGTAGGGYFTHLAGTHDTTTLIIGNSAGAEGGYSFQSGTLSVAGALIVGNEGGGGLTHDGGDATADQVFVGMRDGGVGNYEMNGGTLTATRDLVIGADESLYTAAGNGSFVHNGGVVVTGALHLNGGYNTGHTVGSYILKSDASLDSGGFGSMSNASLFQQDGGQHTNTGLFIVGNSGGSDYDSVYLMGGGQADLNDLWVGGFGRGILNQSDGQVTVSGELRVGDGPNIDPTRRFGEYNLSGGNLTAMGNVIIGAGNGVDADQGFAGEPGGLGTFNQSGGTHLVGGELKIGQSGNVAGGMGLYTQSNGVLTVNGNTFIGGSGLPDGLVDGVGTFTQTGGTHTTIGDMNVGGGLGTYNLSGTGILNTGITYLNSDNGTSFNQSGGTHNTGFLNVYGGDYRFSGGTINVAGNMGVGGPFNSARFTQTGGDVFVNDTGFGLFVGGFDGTSNTGTYTLNTGTLTVVATTHVGSGAVGTFNQTGGIHTTSRLVLGEKISGNGTYNLSGGTLNDSAIIGDAGIGVMNTSGGTHNVNGTLILGNQASGNGTYNLSSTGQVLVTGSTTVGGEGTGALTISDTGSFTGTGFVRLGSAPGSQGQLVLSDSGSLSINYTGTGAQLLVGDEGTGSVLQNGTSSVTTGSLRVGVQGGSTGTYTMDGGTLTVQDGSGVAGGMRIGLGGTGTFTQNAGTHDTTYIEIGGTNFAQGGGGTGVYNLNGGTLVSSGAISTNPQGGSSGTLNVAGGTLTAPVIINKDTLNYSGGSITASINNSANVNVSGGAARTLTGDLSNNTGGTVTVAAATPLTITGVLTQAAGASIKSDSDITVGKDYNNLGAGNGNSFDRHAGVTNVAGATFTSQIIGNNAAQTITGNVASGGTDTFTLDLGNVRGGSGPVTKNYQIANNGIGADIRGAIQTAGANGSNITDGRLSGSGVTAGNFGPIVAGANSGDLAVTLSGPGAALTGQKVAIVSNFDNVSTQIINITGGAVSALAVGNATPNSPSPVALDNFRVGTAGADTSFNVQNQTSGAGAEQLGINSAVASSGFSANNAFGAGLIGPGASATGAVTAKASGSGTAGVNTGTVTINYATDGTNIDAAFTRQAANQQVINVQATGYNAAVGSAAGSGLPTDPINLGNFHVGQVGGAAPQSQSIAITNTVAGPFTESLGVGTASVDNAAFNLSNNIGSGLVAAGTTSNGALSVARAGGTAGVNTGTIAIQYTTDGTGTSGLSAINSNTQNITVNASGYNLAQSNVIAPINIVGHTGDGGGSISQALSITNVSLGDNAYQEGLDSSFGGFTAGIGNTINPTLTGSITNLAAGATDNTSMTVAISTLTAGVFNGTVTVDQASNGLTTSGLGITNLTSQQVAATGGVTVGVFNYAEPTVNNAQPINFGNVRQDGSVANQAISVTNTAPVSAFTEALNGSVVSSPTGFTAVGSFTGLQAASPATANTSISVGMSTAAAGLQSGNVVLGFVSDGTGIAGDGTTTPLSN